MLDTRSLESLAELTLKVGANLAAEQYLFIDGLLEHAPLARALTEVGYRMGARYVDIQYDEPAARLARIQHAQEQTLEWLPPWLEARLDWCAQVRGAHVLIVGDPQPDLLAGVDYRRASLDRTTYPPARARLSRSGEANWTLVPFPSEGWAKSIYGKPDVDQLWSEIKQFLRLEHVDPIGAWQAHIEKLESRAEQMNRRSFDSLHFQGPGTDLTVGLLTQSRWRTTSFTTTWGHQHVSNMPTEEILTTPDYRRTEGTVRATRPLVLGGAVVPDLEMTFSGGKVVEVRAGDQTDLIRGKLATDEGASYLGEVALIDGSSPIGESGRTYLNTLLDENAGSHIAYGAAYPQCVADGAGMSRERLKEVGANVSKIHTDVIIGGPDVIVRGAEQNGHRVKIIEDHDWLLD